MYVGTHGESKETDYIKSITKTVEEPYSAI